MTNVATITGRTAMFVENVQNMVNTYFADNYPDVSKPVISGMKGRRYVRIVRDEIGSRSVFCFVDQTNGNVLFPAGWKGPAKGARSNVMADDVGMSGVNVYGANYR